ncbi:MAG: N-acetylneuraminate synthase family protein [Syntrophaceae bacterium]|nr:N-acetylneuraminate synthase family protein [Syntrophaceae bacterium]
MSPVIRIRQCPRLGKGYAPYLIAEIGTNHNQDLNRAKDLVRVAAEAGFDCVKFQTYEPDEIVSPTVSARDYGLDKYYGDISAVEMFARFLKTPKEWFPELKKLCHDMNLDCATTIHGSHGLAWAKGIGFDVIKIASMDHNNIPFLESIANAIDAPILVSFGMALLEDIGLAIRTLSPHRPGVGMLHCVSMYPPRPEELRLGNIPYMIQHFDVPVGFSDHADDIITSAAAFALGAVFFEKHITLDRKLRGPDHPFALEPQKMKSYVNGIRSLSSELAAGQFVPPTPKEASIRAAYMKSVVAAHDLSTGKLLEFDDLTLVRPGTGIPPRDIHAVIGKTLKKPVARGIPLSWDDISEWR